MKKKIAMFLLVIIFASYGANAQNGDLDSISVDSISVTENSCTFMLHIKGLTAFGYYQINYGPTPNYDLNSTVATLINLVADTTIAIPVTGLISSTPYSFKAQISSNTGVVFGSSSVGTFQTLNCFDKPTISSTTGASICSGGSTLLMCSISGGTYQWKKDSSNIIGEISQNYIATTPGNYSVNVTIGGCTETSLPFTLTVHSLPVVTTNASSLVICNGTSTVLTVTGANSYFWSSGQTEPSINVSPVSDIVYTVIGTNTNGCTDTANINVVVNPLPSINLATSADTICKGTSVNLTASGGSTYFWSSGQTGSSINVIPTINTTYTVTVVDVNGCTKTEDVSVVVNSLPTVTLVSSANTICAGASINLTAGGASSYVFGGGQTSNPITLSPTTNTTYSVTGTDANGCVNNASVSVVVNPLPVVTATASTNAICLNTTTTLTAGGAFSYLWNTGQTLTSFNASPITDTTFSVVGTDLNGCVNTASVSIVVNSLPTIILTASADTICKGTSVNLTASGGISYVFGGGQTSNPLTLSPTTNTSYSVTGTDANGCVSNASVSVVVNPSPTVTVAANINRICRGTFAVLTASGADAYFWNSGQTGPSISVSPNNTTTYSVTVVGTNGCIDTANVTVAVIPSPVVSLSASSLTICKGTMTNLTASGAATYLWSSGQTGPSINVSPVNDTTFSVFGTDINGCVSSNQDSVFITVIKSNLNVSVEVSKDKICKLSMNTIIALRGTPFGGFYSGNGVFGNTFNASNAPAGVNTVTYTYIDASTNCPVSATAVILVDSIPIITGYEFSSNGATNVLTVSGVFNSSLKVKTINSGQIFYPTAQNPTSATFNNIVVNNGDSFVFLYDEDGCSTQTIALAIEDKIKNEDVKVYPNPFVDVLHVEAPYGKYKITIINNLGQVVRNMTVEGSDFEINREDLFRGIYFMNIISSEGKTYSAISKKILVE